MKNTRNTLQRQIVMDAVNSLKTHPTVEELYAEIKEKYPSVSKATVYRNLKHLASSGKIGHIEVPDSADCYDFKCEKHYHMKCRVCGRIFDSEVPYMEHLNRGGNENFTVEGHNIVFSGICSKCKINKKGD